MTVGVRTGAATLIAGRGDTTLRSGDFVALSSSRDAVRVEGLPDADSMDRFGAERDAAFTGGTEHLPPNIGLVSGNLDRYGHWRIGGNDGWVWAPNVGASWRPYTDGQWISSEPFGWTWCSNEPWGWAPYHYGTWGHYAWGWAWCPGPINQYWSPAVVDWSYYDGDYCWTPLCPGEVVYPAFLDAVSGSAIGGLTSRSVAAASIAPELEDSAVRSHSGAMIGIGTTGAVGLAKADSSRREVDPALFPAMRRSARRRYRATGLARAAGFTRSMATHRRTSPEASR